MARRLAVVALGVGLLAGCTSQSAAPSAPPPVDPAQAAAVDKVVQEAMKARHLRAVIVRVTVDGKEIITKAYGESMTGVPATVDMHFRNGAVAISYVSTLLLMLVDEKKVSLDDKASKWVPEIPHSDEVTLGQLAQMTTGYTDYVIGNAEFDAMLYTDPFRQWTPEELLATVTSKPLLYPPGTNWNYAHTNYLILGLALEKATGKTDVGSHAGEGARPAGADEHHRSRPRNARHPRARAARLHLRTSIAAGHPGGNPLLRGVHVLEPVVDDHPGRHPDDEHLRRERDGGGDGDGQAAVSGVVPGDDLDRPARQDDRRCPGARPASRRARATATGSASSRPATGSCRIRCSPARPAPSRTCPRRRSRSPSRSRSPRTRSPRTASYKSEVGGNAADPVWREIATVVAPEDPPPDQAAVAAVTRAGSRSRRGRARPPEVRPVAAGIPA